jgi:hypothetical protein
VGKLQLSVTAATVNVPVFGPFDAGSKTSMLNVVVPFVAPAGTVKLHALVGAQLGPQLLFVHCSTTGLRKIVPPNALAACMSASQLVSV